MSELLDDVTKAFNTESAEHIEGVGSFKVITSEDEERVGFTAFRGAYEKLLLSTLRKCYRHFAGADMPGDGDALIEKTAPFVGPLLTDLAIRAFADGVLIGQQDDPLVKMAIFYNNVESLFTDDDHHETVRLLANGFRADADVLEHFNLYVLHCLEGISHATGFAHEEMPPSKVWDVWCLTGAATEAASYMAGLRMGDAWKVRDELDGIAIASKEGSDDNPS